MVNLFTDHHRHLDDDGVLVVRMTADSKTMSLVAVVEQRLLSLPGYCLLPTLVMAVVLFESLLPAAV